MRKLCLLGNRFGKLTVMSEILNDSGQSKWLCQCDCGKEKISVGWHLTRGKVKSCGCMYLKNDRTGHKYGKWTVLKYAGNETWKCLCDCGTIRNVHSSSLALGRSASCGCFFSPCDEEYNKRKMKDIQDKITIQENGCWDWNLYKNDRGYGTISYRRKPGQRINRIIWLLWNGKIPEGMFVLHKCDRPQCCNPDHLFLGTHEDNMRDMASKGRACQGEKHHLYIKSRRKRCLTN